MWKKIHKTFPSPSFVHSRSPTLSHSTSQVDGWVPPPLSLQEREAWDTKKKRKSEKHHSTPRRKKEENAKPTKKKKRIGKNWDVLSKINNTALPMKKECVPAQLFGRERLL